MHQMSVMLLTLATFSAAGGQLLFKIGARGREQLFEFFNLPIAVGLLLYAAGTLIWIYVLSYEKLVNVYAFTALTFVLVYLGGVLFIHERISMAATIGILLVLAGLYLIVNFNS